LLLLLAVLLLALVLLLLLLIKNDGDPFYNIKRNTTFYQVELSPF